MRYIIQGFLLLKNSIWILCAHKIPNSDLKKKERKKKIAKYTCCSNFFKLSLKIESINYYIFNVLVPFVPFALIVMPFDRLIKY